MPSQVFWKGFAPVGNRVVVRDMSLQPNVAGQNITFAMINAATDAPLTGATIVGFLTKDTGAQASAAGTFTELTPTGNAIYNYAITQAETNASCVSLLATATDGVPINMMFLTGGLHRGVPGQTITFGLYTTSGAADPSASPTVEVSKDGGSLVAGGGTVTNLGNGQYRYAPTAAETNATNAVTFVASAAGDVTQCIIIFVVP